LETSQKGIDAENQKEGGDCTGRWPTEKKTTGVRHSEREKGKKVPSVKKEPRLFVIVTGLDADRVQGLRGEHADEGLEKKNVGTIILTEKRKWTPKHSSPLERGTAPL